MLNVCNIVFGVLAGIALYSAILLSYDVVCRYVCMYDV